MNTVTFSVPTFRKESIEAKLTKLAKKAAKYGNDDITFSFGDTYTKVVEGQTGKIKIQFIDIAVSGNPPKVGRWLMVARVELLDGLENLVHGVPGSDVVAYEAFRTHGGHCDHCNTARRRNDVYVMSDGTSQIAVGRACLRDFLGIDDPKAIVNRAQFFEEVAALVDRDDLTESYGDFGYYNLNDILASAAYFIRTIGFVSASKSRETGHPSTSDAVRNWLRGSVDAVPTDADHQQASKTREFFGSRDTFGNTYLDNIRVLFGQDIVETKHIALTVSAVSAAQRETAPKPQTAQSAFVGEIKQRLRGICVTIQKIIFLGSGEWGPSYIHIMEDPCGNVLTWVTGRKLDCVEGSTLTLDASIKQHVVYGNIKQTVLTRAKVHQ